jgi:type III secretory pathway component EscU
MNLSERKDDEAPWITLGLWIGLLLPPAVWGIHLQFVYAASEQVCKGQLSLTTVNVISAICIAAAIGAGILATGLWFGAGRIWPSEAKTDLIARQRFLSAEGMLSSLLFSIIVVGQWTGVLYLTPCAH